ncbi:MAG TPA: outer membrane protein assembly factor BamA [Gammaproteobacteria bacterium]|jgi:outer membrane protein insertion porin family|nr:outer membrane protein assembly factor BamA [Gammaproteobacteria bacterium]
MIKTFIPIPTVTIKKLAFLLICLFQLTSTAWAQAFVVQRIEIQGLQRASAQTVESYLPIKRGQTLQPSQTGEILAALYKTGFFEHITLSRENNTLIIRVVERPTIGQLKISGNSAIPTDKLTAVMTSLDIAEGRIYNPAMLEKIKQGLLNQYYHLGRYNAHVDVSTIPMSRNRIAVQINISEGLTAKIQRISILGNHAFDEDTLVKQLDISTSGLFTFITQADHYSEEKLEASLDKLRHFYFDRGYIRFQVKSAQAQVTPDRKSIYVNFVVDEGKPYTVKAIELAGPMVVPREELQKQIHIKPGDVFSRAKIIEAEKNITKYLGNKGYVFAHITLQPRINDAAHTVVIVLDIQPGKRAYVRHVTFSENNHTNDIVLRREIEQMESAPASAQKMETSKNRLSLLPYIREVNMSLQPVSGTEDQVDVNYKIKEDSAAQASVKLGYTQLYHLTFGAGLNHKNFLGTGNTLGLNFTRSRYEQLYSVDYTNPYYTPEGISRTFNFSVMRVDPGAAANVSSGYTINEYNLGVMYGIPINQQTSWFNTTVFSRFFVGATYQDTLVNLDRANRANVSNQVNNFINDHGRHFQEIDLRVGYSRDSRDKAIFPTRGAFQTFFADGYVPVTKNSLTYYLLNYQGKLYQPLVGPFILVTKADFGYGNGLHGIGDFPFFKNYFAGGFDSVRGYQGFTLGPRDSKDNAFGGNMLADASIGVIFPNYISENLRTTLFVDAGNVYLGLDNRKFGGYSTNAGPIRYSVGIQADVLTPFGPIQVSLAQPMNRRSGDKSEVFQFSLGASL